MQHILAFLLVFLMFPPDYVPEIASRGEKKLEGAPNTKTIQKQKKV
jgi:hypothetical protein